MMDEEFRKSHNKTSHSYILRMILKIATDSNSLLVNGSTVVEVIDTDTVIISDSISDHIITVRSVLKRQKP